MPVINGAGPAIAIDAGLITRRVLPDPVDRFLVATTRSLDATLLTVDRRILDYAAPRTICVCRTSRERLSG